MERYINEYLIEHNIVKASNINLLTEEEKAQITDGVVTKLYSSIKKKALSANFGEIDITRGDLTKLKNYNDITNAIKYLKKIANKGQEGNDLKQVVPVLEGAIVMLTSHKAAFQKAYSNKNNMVKYLYESSTIALIQVTSHAVSEAVTYVNAGSYIESKPVKTKNLLKNNSLKSLKKLVDMNKSNKFASALGELSTLHESIRINSLYNADAELEQLTEAEKLSSQISGFIGSLDTKAGDLVSKIGKVTQSSAFKNSLKALKFLGAILVILQCIRPMIGIFISSRIKLAQYIQQLSDFVELNAASVTDAEVKKKQEKWVERLRKMAQKIDVDQSVASNRTEEEINDETYNDSNNSSDDDLGIM